ncbi:MAG: hypothetical protein AB2793_17715 [Candidatus Thiodiazotropha sp.]
MMKDSLFLPHTENEDDLYRAIQDDHHLKEFRTLLEKMWDGYKQYAPRGFRQNLQDSFHNRWWEMYLTLGILQLGFDIATNKQDIGPDIKLIVGDSSLWMEAVAPSKGEASDRVPVQEPNTATKMPKREGLLRLTQSILSKKEAFERYVRESVVQVNEPCIIALSGCNLGLGDTLNSPCPAPMSILTGVDNLVLTPEGQYYTQRQSIQRDSGSVVDTAVFENEDYQIISAVLYSYDEPLSAPNPRDSLKLFLNPHAKNPVPPHVYDKFVETWVYTIRDEAIGWDKV